MKKAVVILLVCAMLLVPMLAMAAEKTALVLTVQAAPEEEGVLFHVQTNLPDGSEGMISLFSTDQEYRGQTKFEITNGEALVGPFSNKGEPLTDGEYDLSVSFSTTRLQPESVQAIVGKDYENYESEYIDDGFIDMETTVTMVGGTPAADVSPLAETVEALYGELAAEYANHQEKFDQAVWAAFARDFKGKVDAAAADTGTPMDYQIVISDLALLMNKYAQDLQGRGDADMIQSLEQEIDAYVGR